MPGKRGGLPAAFLSKLDNICGRMKAQGHPTRIYWGLRTLAQQVRIATRGRTFAKFKAFMLEQQKKGNVTATAAQKWIDHYDPEVGKHPMDAGFKSPTTWTLKSAHLTGKAADVAHPTEGWNPKAGAAYWNALKAAANAEGLQIGPPASDRAHVQGP